MVQDIIQFTRLARIIHEFCSFVNKRLQESMFAFLQASTRCFAPCSGLALSGGPALAGPKSKPGGRIVHAS